MEDDTTDDIDGACTERPAATLALSGANASVSIARHAAQNKKPKVSLDLVGVDPPLLRLAMIALGRRAGSCIQRQARLPRQDLRSNDQAVQVTARSTDDCTDEGQTSCFLLTRWTEINISKSLVLHQPYFAAARKS